MPFEFTKQQGYGFHRGVQKPDWWSYRKNRPRLGGEESARKRGSKFGHTMKSLHTCEANTAARDTRNPPAVVAILQQPVEAVIDMDQMTRLAALRSGQARGKT
jgi:hypothetical protein